MAQFTGTGSFTITGATSKIHDIQFYNHGGVSTAGGTVRGCLFGQNNGTSQVSLLKTTGNTLAVIDCTFSVQGIAISAGSGFADNLMVTACVFTNCEKALVTVGTGNQLVAFTDNQCFSSEDWTVELVGVLNALVADNQILDGGGTANGGISADSNCSYVVVTGNVIQAIRNGSPIETAAPNSVISHNLVQGAAAGSATTITVNADKCLVVDNQLRESDGNGIDITGDDCVVEGNLVDQPGLATDDTYDALTLTGDRNLVIANKLIPSAFGFADTRYGVNVVSGDCNMVVGNDLGDPADYGTDALLDNGTATQLNWPADATYGDNFTDCVTSP